MKEVKPEFKFDMNAIQEHLSKIEVEVNKQQGKPGCNPFVFLEEHVNPLLDRLQGRIKKVDSNGKVIIKAGPPERTEELWEAIMRLPTEIPKPNMTVDENPTGFNIKEAPPKAPGLIFPGRG